MTIKDSCSHAPSEEDPRIEGMLSKLVEEPRAFFKHQVREDPDLSPEEKTELARRLLHEKPDAFLLRYGSFLSEEHLSYFAEIDLPLVQSVLKEMQSSSHQCVKNRRWAAWQRMIAFEDPFVSREGMRTRHPALFEHFFGPGSVQREVSSRTPRSDCTLSGMILEHAELEEERRLLRSQTTQEEEEEDESDEEEEMGDPFLEFRASVCQRFLQGLEERFDYASVDGEEDYDDLLTRERDEEEKYFDE